MPKNKVKYSAEEKKSAIINSAEKFFATKAFHEVMMSDIAKDSVSAKGTIYKFVETKEELFYLVIIERLNELYSLLKSINKDSVNPVSKINLFITAYFNFVKLNKYFSSLINYEYLFIKHQLSNEAELIKNEINKELISIIEYGIKNEVFHSQNINLFTSLIINSINNNKNKHSINEIYEFIFNILIKNKNKYTLSGKSILLTRTFEQSKESLKIFEDAGASVVLFPTLEIVPPDNWNEFDETVKNQNQIDYIIFSSTHSVKMFYERLKELNINFDFSDKIIVAVGNKTAQQLRNFNINVNIIPKKFSGSGVVEELNTHNLRGKNIFIPRSVIGREELPEGLKSRGAILKTVPVYNITVPPKSVTDSAFKKLNIIQPDIYIFTSPSTFGNFCEIINEKNPENYFKGKVVAAIGPTTAHAIESHNVKTEILPEEYTMEGLRDSIIKYYLLKEKN